MLRTTRSAPLYQDLIALCGVILACLMVAVGYAGRYAFDDSYVGYAFARSLLLGHGYVFDHGPGSLLSTSAPLAVPFYAACAKLFRIDIVDVAQVTSVIAIAVLGISVYTIVRSYAGVFGAFCATAVMVLSPFIQVDWSHETLIAISLLALGIAMLTRGQFATASIVIGIASLCRGEVLFALAALLLYPSAVLTLRKRLVLCIVALLPYAAWSSFAVAHFGTPFSSTIASKAAQGRYGSITLFLHGSLDYIKEIFKAFTFPHVLPITAVMLALTAACMAAARRPRFGEMLAIGLSVAVCVLYVGLRLPFYFWFTTQFAIITAVLVAAPWVSTRRPPPFSATMLWTARGASVVLTAIMVFLGLRMAGSNAKYNMSQIMVMPQIQTNAYRKLGEWLGTHTRSSDLVSVVEFGKIHYYSGRNVIDPLGILAPGVSKQLALGNAIWEVERYKPDVIVESDDFHYFVDPTEYQWFARAYRLTDRLNFERDPSEASRTHFRIYRLVAPAAVAAPLAAIPRTVSRVDIDAARYTFHVSAAAARRVELRVKSPIGCDCAEMIIVRSQNGVITRRSIRLAGGVERVDVDLASPQNVTEVTLSGEHASPWPVAGLRTNFTLWKSDDRDYHLANALSLYR